MISEKNNKPLKESDMHIVGSLFGARIVPRTNKDKHEMIELYIEDDGYYSKIASFSSYWVSDLLGVASRLKLRNYPAMEADMKQALKYD